jgi:mRNA-degrading endonuclease toxin of MazEF toxin-antitoxin module
VSFPVEIKKILDGYAEALKALRFEVAVKGTRLYYKGEPLVRWVWKPYRLDGAHRGYGVFYVGWRLYNDNGRPKPDEILVELDGFLRDTAVLTDCVASIVDREALWHLPFDAMAIGEETGKGLFIIISPTVRNSATSPLSAAIVIDIPYYYAGEVAPDQYKIYFSLQGYDSTRRKPIFEPIGAVEPAEFGKLRRLVKELHRAIAVMLL